MNAHKMAWGLTAVALMVMVGGAFSPEAWADFIPASGDYATGSNWNGGLVPSGTASAHIAWNTGGSRTANYASGTSYTTTGRFLAGLGSGIGRLDMDPGAATLTFGGDDFGEFFDLHDGVFARLLHSEDNLEVSATATHLSLQVVPPAQSGH